MGKILLFYSACVAALHSGLLRLMSEVKLAHPVRPQLSFFFFFLFFPAMVLNIDAEI